MLSLSDTHLIYQSFQSLGASPHTINHSGSRQHAVYTPVPFYAHQLDSQFGDIHMVMATPKKRVTMDNERALRRRSLIEALHVQRMSNGTRKPLSFLPYLMLMILGPLLVIALCIQPLVMQSIVTASVQD